MKTWRFTALDSLFFREARPFDSIGDSELSTVFPPPVATLAGAIRVAIGNHQHINWADYKGSELEKQMGNGDSLGKLRIKGVFLNFQDERLYPVPAHLVIKDKTLHFLQVGEPVRCDLGNNVCLAVAPKDEQGKYIEGIKPLENHWLTQAGLEKVLKGDSELVFFDEKQPEKADLIPASKLFEREIHLGIGRNNQTRTAEQGLLYQTQHIRPKQGLAIDVDIEGLENVNCPISGIVRLGGEGRGAAFEVIKQPVGWAEARSPSLTHAQDIKLILLSAVYVEQKNGYTPLPNFEKHEQDGKTIWKGKINKVDLTLYCAIVGKTVREGGWDLQKQQPKTVRSLIPAGSVFYCTVDNGGYIGQQFDQQTDLDEALGRGLFAVCF